MCNVESTERIAGYKTKGVPWSIEDINWFTLITRGYLVVELVSTAKEPALASGVVSHRGPAGAPNRSLEGYVCCWACEFRLVELPVLPQSLAFSLSCAVPPPALPVLPLLCGGDGSLYCPCWLATL